MEMQSPPLSARIEAILPALRLAEQGMADASRKIAEAITQWSAAHAADMAAIAQQIGNLKPAPFFLTESVVRSLVDPESPAGPREVAVPIEPTELVDRPRRSEDPCLAKANDDVPEVSSETAEALGRAAQAALNRMGRPDPVAPVTIHISNNCEPGSGCAPVTAKRPRRGKRGATPMLEGGADPKFRFRIPPATEPARKADVMHRQAKDRDARELEQPVDRMALIRTAARKLALPASTNDFRPLPGAPAGKKPATALPLLPGFARRQRLQAAMMFLKRQCILVSPVDRSALVMRYRVSGKRDPMYAEDVIAFAIERGFAEGDAA